MTKEDDEILWHLIIKTYWKSIKEADLSDTSYFIKVVKVNKWDVSFISQYLEIIDSFEIIKGEGSLFQTVRLNKMKYSNKHYSLMISRPSKNESKAFVSHFYSWGSLAGYGEDTKWTKNAEGLWHPQSKPDVETMS